jgi:hypothetical protein
MEKSDREDKLARVQNTNANLPKKSSGHGI